MGRFMDRGGHRGRGSGRGAGRGISAPSHFDNNAYNQNGFYHHPPNEPTYSPDGNDTYGTYDQPVGTYEGMRHKIQIHNENSEGTREAKQFMTLASLTAVLLTPFVGLYKRGAFRGDLRSGP